MTGHPQLSAAWQRLIGKKEGHDEGQQGSAEVVFPCC